MYTRVVMFRGASDLDAGVEFVRNEVAPVLRQQHGYQGLTTSIDRSSALIGVMSTWETEADREASDSAMSKIREEAQTVIGGEMTIENFELAVIDVAGRPAVGSSLLVRRISMDPARIEESLEFFREEVLPRIKESSGYLATRNMIDRQTGEGFVGTVWTDNASMEAAAEAADARRALAADRGITFSEQTRREVMFVDMP